MGKILLLCFAVLDTYSIFLLLVGGILHPALCFAGGNKIDIRGYTVHGYAAKLDRNNNCAVISDTSVYLPVMGNCFCFVSRFVFIRTTGTQAQFDDARKIVFTLYSDYFSVLKLVSSFICYIYRSQKFS